MPDRGFPRTLITGGESMTAQYLLREISGNAVICSRQELDISDTRQFEHVVQTERIEVVINTAGATKGNRQTLLDVNGHFPGGLARSSRTLGVCFVYLSSARVFDGTSSSPYLESDLPRPIDNYGTSKLIGEQAVAEACAGGMYYIFRIPMMIGRRRKHPEGQILSRLMHQARRGDTVRAAEDVYHSPVFAGDVAGTICRHIGMGLPPGLYHLSNKSHVSLFDLTRKVFAALGESAAVIPVRAEVFEKDGPIARNQVLGCESLKPLIDWEPAVERFADEIRSAA